MLKKRLLVLFFPMLLHGQYSIGESSRIFVDSLRNNRSVPVKIFYPAVATGIDLAPVSGSFPVLVVGHGFLMSSLPYRNLADTLVPMGYILVLPETESGGSPNHSTFGRDLLFSGEEFIRRGQQDAGFLWYNRVSGRLGISGHSMGGGATYLAGSYAQAGTVSCLVGFAAAETNPSAVAAASGLMIPSLMFSGSADGVTPASAHQIPIHAGLLGCKVYSEIPGGGHCMFFNGDAACDFGELVSSPTISISRAEQQRQMFYILKPWLGHYLMNDAQAWTELMARVGNSPPLSNVSLCSTTSIELMEEEDGRFWYSGGRVYFSGLQSGELVVYDIRGSELWRSTIETGEGSIVFPVFGFVPSVYFLRWTGVKGVRTLRVWVE
jgi:dienelactone hydrolase